MERALFLEEATFSDRQKAHSKERNRIRTELWATLVSDLFLAAVGLGSLLEFQMRSAARKASTSQTTADQIIAGMYARYRSHSDSD
jgi:hypothetical protein